MLYRIITISTHTGEIVPQFTCDSWSSGDELMEIGGEAVFHDGGDEYEIHGHLFVANIIKPTHKKSIPTLICTLDY